MSGKDIPIRAARKKTYDRVPDPPSIPRDSHSEGPPFITEAGPTDSEEDTYYDFGDGFDNFVAVQRVATMLDTITGLEVATKIAESWRYETLNEFKKGLNDGQALGIKAEDVEKTSRALKRLMPILTKVNMKTKVSISSLHLSICKRRFPTGCFVL